MAEVARDLFNRNPVKRPKLAHKTLDPKYNVLQSEISVVKVSASKDPIVGTV